MAANANANALPQIPQPGLFQGFLMPAPADSLIGRPMYFTAGQFAGRTIRAEMVEIQKANFSRQ